MKSTKTLLRLIPTVALMAILSACGSDSDSPTSPSDGTLVKEDVTIGTGATAVAGDVVTVSYIGTLTNGSVFDSGTLGPTRIGVGGFVKGFDDGVVGMRVGGRRKLTIPPNLGYGSQGVPGVIPGNATIKFDVTLLAIVGK